jgi:hypothetical protein
VGIDRHVATALLQLVDDGLAGAEILCLGRQEMYLTASELARITMDRPGWTTESRASVLQQPYADAFLRQCGFQTVRSLDANAFEGADVLHDLNAPLPPELHGVTGFLYDGGTLEHVFDVAAAFKCTIDLVRVGGLVLFTPPANNLCGHGFYQFSPEFFFRFLEANGFDSITVYLVGMGPSGVWLRAQDPRGLGRRIQFGSSEALQFVVLARKVRSLPELVRPQQSDYAQMEWVETPEQRQARKQQQFSLKKRLRDQIIFRVAFPLAVAARHMLGLRLGTGVPGLWLRSWFTPVDPARERLFRLDDPA